MGRQEECNQCILHSPSHDHHAHVHDQPAPVPFVLPGLQDHQPLFNNEADPFAPAPTSQNIRAVMTVDQIREQLAAILIPLTPPT